MYYAMNFVLSRIVNCLNPNKKNTTEFISPAFANYSLRFLQKYLVKTQAHTKKVITHKSQGKLSLVEQDTIEYRVYH